jgi:hypothetical protein
MVVAAKSDHANTTDTPRRDYGNTTSLALEWRQPAARGMGHTDEQEIAVDVASHAGHRRPAEGPASEREGG